MADILKEHEKPQLRPIGQHTLSNIALQLNATLDLEKLLLYTVNAASLLTTSDAAILLLPDRQQRHLTVEAYYNATDRTESLLGKSLPIADTIEGRVLKNGVYFHHHPTDPPYDFFDHVAQAVVYMPMMSRNEVLGVLGVLDFGDDGETRFTREKSNLLKQLAAHAAVAIENARTYEDSQARSLELAPDC